LYANFCSRDRDARELILDFWAHAQPFGVPTEPVEVKQRIVTNYFTAKRMLQALHMSVQRHEQAIWRAGDRRAEARGRERIACGWRASARLSS